MPISKDLLEAYSRGEITRRDIEARVDKAVNFGQLLMQLHEHNLPWPRFPSDRQSVGVQLIKRLAERAPHVG
jgi:hypothetical protein